MRRVVLLGLGLLLLGPPLRAVEDRKVEAPRVGTKIEVPYRLTLPKHIMVRAKINGKGPFNFILDTGAPALFVATKVCKKLGIEPDKTGWGTFDRFEIEGGAVFPKARGRIEDPFQLEGMNGMGLAGAELHGVIGYNLLAQYRLEIDFTRDKMVWTKLDFVPKAPVGLGGKGGGQGGMEIFGSIMKMLGTFLGRQADPVVVTRGFLGVEVEEDAAGDVVVKTVLKGGPSAAGGLKVGDKISKIRGRSVYGKDGWEKLVRGVQGGETVKVEVQRGKDMVAVSVKSGEGL